MKRLFKIATPISNLFKNKDIKERIINLSEILELRELEVELGNEFSYIYHSDLNILAKWNDQDIKKLEEIGDHYQIQCVSYHLASRYQNNVIEDNSFVGVGKLFKISEMKMNVKQNLKISMKIFGLDTPILVENINHLLTDAYDDITEAEFIHEIVKDNDIYLLLDISHVKITAYNKKIDFMDYINKLPLDRCKQIHLSSYNIKNGKAIDSHEELTEEDWSTFKNLIKIVNSVEYVTIEYYKDGEKLINQLEKLKGILQKTLISKILRVLDWDTNFFGYKVARIECTDLYKRILNGCIEKAKKDNIRCIYYLSEQKNQEILESVGFKRIEGKVDYAYRTKNIDPPEDVEIEEAKLEDLPEIKKIASRVFRGVTRFYKDPNFDRQKIDTFYQIWIDKLMKDDGSTILIIIDNNRIVAFNGISFNNGVGRIFLIAVDEDFKNKGYGEILIKQAYKFFIKNIKNLESEGINIYKKDEKIYKMRVNVSTQDDNIAAKILYEKMGFVNQDTKYWFHWWNEEDLNRKTYDNAE